MLMCYFVSIADREGLETYLQSQMVAHKLYRRLGWEDVECLDTDLSKWGPDQDLGIHRIVCMVRPPKPLR